MSDQYIVSARKYRPATFHSVVGQSALTSTLKNAVAGGRLAHAYLFTGPRGVGKTSCARIFAKTINCSNLTPEGEACGQCESCLAIERGSSMNIIELDAASNNSVDDIRALTEQVGMPPQMGRYRVFIIDEVHMLTSQAFNAFLKTLEEPPSYVVFILATTEKHKVLPTILSRCQIYDFKRITIADIVEHLQYVASQEGITADPAALNVIARKADGGMRDALSIFDQVAAYSRGNITYEGTIANLNVLDYDYYFKLVECFRAGDVPGALLIYKEIRDKGFDSLFFVNGLASHVRDLMVAADERTLPLLEVAADVAAKYSEQAKSLPIQWYYVALKLLNDCDVAYRTSTGKQLLVELTLIRLSQLLTPPTPPFDRVDAGIPLKTPARAGAPAPAATSTSPAPAASAPASAPAPVSAPAPAPEAAPASPQPQPSASSAPHPAPHAAPRVAARRPGSMSVRLSDIKAEAEAETSERAEKRGAVTPEAFMAAWEEYQRQNADKHLLVAAMRGATPEQTAPEAFRLTVDHPASQQAFETVMPRLISFLREKVGNDFVTLEVKVSEEELTKRLPPQEFLKQIVSSNPAMADLLSHLDAELD